MAHTLFLFLILLFSLPSPALLNGQRVPASAGSNAYPVVSLKIKHAGEIVRCTGTFVSKNTLLTAAHCFDPVTFACRQFKNCSLLETRTYRIENTEQTSLTVNDVKYSSEFRLAVHPDYRSVQSIGYENYDRTNNDVAIIIFPAVPVRQTYVRVSRNSPRKGDSLWTYGSGMTQVKLFSNPATGEAYNIEESAGVMKKIKSTLNTSPLNGLFELQSILIGRRIESHLYDLSVKEGLQVLSADSGGPLIHDKKIIGVIRNFAFAFFPSVGKSAKMEVSGRSIFTSITTESQQRFLKSVQKHGGRVAF